MNKYTRINWENTPSTATPLTADNLNHMDEGIEQATDGATAVEEALKTATAELATVKSEVETARGSSSSLNARLNGIDSSVTNKAEKSTVSQLSARMQTAEKALTGKANATDVANALKAKEDNANKVSSKTDITDSSTNYPSIEYLGEYYYDTNETYSSEETDKFLATKYDSSNIELGTATLTPYSTQIDKIKSATCLYEKFGDIVIVNVTVIMNATTLGGTSTIALLNMPFSNKSDVIVHDIGISKNGGMFRGSVNKSAWLQFTPLNKQAYNFVADEQVNFSLIYKI